MAQTYSINDLEFKGNIGLLFEILKSGKTLTHAQVMAFKKAHKLRSAYALLFRLRREGLKYKAFTITVGGGDTRATRTFKLVRGVPKGTTENWPKANPTRGEARKPAAKKVTKKATKRVTAGGGSDDEATME